MRRWILFLPLILLLSCSSYNKITYINSKPSQHESYEDDYKYNYVANNSYEIVNYDSVNDLVEVEMKNEPLIETTLVVDEQMEREIVKPTLNEVVVKNNNFSNEKKISNETKVFKKDVKESKEPFQKNKKERNEKIIKLALIIANVIVFAISPTWGLITAPLTLSFVACLLYPKWIRQGYLNTPYLKIAVFVAAYGTFIANLWWMILFLAL